MYSIVQTYTHEKEAALVGAGFRLDLLIAHRSCTDFSPVLLNIGLSNHKDCSYTHYLLCVSLSRRTVI